MKLKLLTQISEYNKTRNLPVMHYMQLITDFMDRKEMGHLRNLDCRNMTLPFLNIEGMDLSGSDFTGADLSHANFKNCKLDGVKLEGATLTFTVINPVLLGKEVVPDCCK